MLKRRMHHCQIDDRARNGHNAVKGTRRYHDPFSTAKRDLHRYAGLRGNRAMPEAILSLLI